MIGDKSPQHKLLPPEADGAALDAIHAEMQAALDRARLAAETAFGQNNLAADER
ncbi:MAG: hypothetical protein ABSG52_15065 [Terriglobales bacterium]